MNISSARKIADAVLYEGYMLYPYRRSAVKNRQRWSFGILYPPTYEEVRTGTEHATMHSECLIEIRDQSALRVEVQLRFLHLARVQVEEETAKGPIDTAVIVDGRLIQSRDEAEERSVELDWPASTSQEFRFGDRIHDEVLTDATGEHLGTVTRMQDEVCGRIRLASEHAGEQLLKLYIDVFNASSAHNEITRDAALMRSLLSSHCVLGVSGGEFISLLDPPEKFKAAASTCRNVRNFPVLVGEEPARDMLLCSPILLYDYPKVAPESAGDFFDSTEMDEMLTLRVMTLTDEEKNKMQRGDDRVRELLQRTEMTAREQLTRTHGTIRSMSPSREDE